MNLHYGLLIPLVIIGEGACRSGLGSPRSLQHKTHSYVATVTANIGVVITYTLPYGKNTDRDRIETESKINSAILHPF